MPKDYEASANNFGVTQNSDGLIFIANDNGVLIYDGITWDICKRNDEITIMSIGKTSAGEIVAGTIDGDIALISKHKSGRFKYVSLLDKISPEKRPKEAIRQITTVGESTYFLSSDKLIEYKNSKLVVYEPLNSFHSRLLVMGKHIFISDIQNHLSVLQEGKLEPIENTNILSNEKFFFCYKLNSVSFAIGFRNLGIYIAVYDSIHPTKTKFLKKNSFCDNEFALSEINNGCLLNNGNYIVTTNKNGAFELDTSLKIVSRFDSKNGIYDNNIKSAFQDKNGNLWLALYYGVTFVEINSSLTNYTRSNGITGLVQSASYFDNKLFIATDKGVQYYDSLEEKFKIFRDFNKQSWFLLSFQDKLFFGTAKGLFVYVDGRIIQLSENNTFSILSDPYRPELIYAGTEEGVDVFTIKKNSIEKIDNYQLNSAVRNLTSDFNRNIYFATADRGIFFLNYQKSYALDSIQIKQSLNEQEVENCVFSYKGRLLIGTGKGIYTVKSTDKKNFRCLKDPQFWPLTKVSQVFRASQIENGIICSQKYPFKEKDRLEQKITFLEQDKITLTTSLRILNHLSDVKPNSISTDSLRNIVFICADEGLFIFNGKKRIAYNRFNLILKKFKTTTDTLLENVISDSSSVQRSLLIPYESNNVQLSLGFTSYEASGVEFSHMLEGRDKSFSRWEKQNQLSFNNLREGDYTLKIKARTELEEKIYTMEIPFTILPPWYRSVYAYIVYFVLFVVFVYVLVRLNSRRLENLNKKLEKTIEERTSTISLQKEEIEHKQKEILDSINYAQRIQRALLASESLLKENLPDHFVFFQPKDVVSGDFYWASLLSNGQFALVTADSTGHGVPGAIMSMLNISCLKEAVEAEKLTAPSNILNHTRKKVIETLANDGSAEGGKDGMDCSLLCFDLVNNQFSYAAANNPVWVVRKKAGDENAEVSQKSDSLAGEKDREVTSSGTNLELIELSPDKMPVGKHDRDSVSFNQHGFHVQKGDMIYTLTDGLPDQFGGPKGKKFMYKKLKDLLLSISQLALAEQKNKLADTLEEWKGDLEQVDDITLIGVRII